jgi:transposase
MTFVGWQGGAAMPLGHVDCWLFRSFMRVVRAARRRLGVGLQIVRDWVARFNQHVPDGLKAGKAKGREPLLNDKQRKALVEAIEKGPVPYLDGVVRWRLVDLAQWLWQEHRISVSRRTLGCELNAMGYRKLTARPKHHAQDPQAIEDFKKTSPALWRKSPPEWHEESE